MASFIPEISNRQHHPVGAPGMQALVSKTVNAMGMPPWIGAPRVAMKVPARRGIRVKPRSISPFSGGIPRTIIDYVAKLEGQPSYGVKWTFIPGGCRCITLSTGWPRRGKKGYQLRDTIRHFRCRLCPANMAHLSLQNTHGGEGYRTLSGQHPQGRKVSLFCHCSQSVAH